MRDLGICIGHYEPGPLNAITDVAGVRVGHTTCITDLDDGGCVRTGVTAIMPNAGNIFMDRLIGGAFVLNGAGEMSGLIQVLEWGLVETPILLTNTLSVGTVSASTVRYMVERYPGIGDEHDVIIPLVGECDDSFLNDITAHHIEASHVFAALDAAQSGPVEEGNVGGGTGMVSFDLKGGIGTASRRLPESRGGFTLGVLVMTNVGNLRDLRVDGAPVGAGLGEWFSDYTARRHSYGSIIAVLATDAPLTTHQCNRLCKRVALGIGRAGSFASHHSGEIVIGFSTANVISRSRDAKFISLNVLSNQWMDPLYEAVIECAEEAILNALCMATTMTGVRGNVVPALPLDRLVTLFERPRLRT